MSMCSNGRGRKAAEVVAVLCLAGLWFAVAASGAGWSNREIAANNASHLPLFGISCPTVSLCVAVGGGNTIATATAPTGGTDSWKVVYAGDGSGEPNQDQIRGVSCPSSRLCVAVTFEGQVYTSTEPTGGAGDWQVTDLSADGPNLHLYGVSCPSPGFCAASAGGAQVATSTNPTGGPGAWHVTQLQGPMELRGISCASAALCVAVGDDGADIRPAESDQALITQTTNPLAGDWSAAPMPGRQSLFGVSCPSSDLCVSGDSIGNLLLTTDPSAGAGGWRQIDGGGSVQITDVDCVSVSLCLAIDSNGDVLTSTDPLGGAGKWTFENLAPYPGVDGTAANALFGASCSSPGLCAIVANGGQIFTSSDPFAPPLTGATTNPSGKKRPRPKRPRVQIAAAPPPGLEIRSGSKVGVLYRFFAKRHARVKGYLCRIDRRPLKRCQSPKTYRVARGHHVFRVRAIGWSGLRGPVAVHRFEACSPKPLPQCVDSVRDSRPGESARRVG